MIPMNHPCHGSRGLRGITPIALVVLLFGSSHAAADEPLVVHEWGVMIREGGDLLGPPVELFDAVPKFVLQHHKHFKPPAAPIIRIWDKPVLHFYGKPGTKVTVRVMTPKGRPLMYWPQPKLLSKAAQVKSGYSVAQATGLEWTGTLADEPPANLSRVTPGHWWSTARKIPSQYLETNSGSERFIFYEATGKQEPTVTARVTADAVTLSNSDKDASSPVVLLVRDDGAIVARSVDSIPANAHVRLLRKDLLSSKRPAFSDDGVLEMCRKQWQSMGMTRDESQHIVNIWKSDLLKGGGFLLVSRLPSRLYEAMFPLTITPKPTEITRVGMIFDPLHDQPDRVEWLPRTAARVERLVEQLGDDQFVVRSEATTELAKLAHLAESQLKVAANSKDSEVASRAKQLLEALAKRREGKALPAAPVPSTSTPVFAPGDVILRIDGPLDER